ncbi:MAG: phosphodiesterase [Pseudomonadota bacterium]
MTLIVQLTDTHVTAPGRLAYRKVDTHAALARAVAHINALPARVGPIDAVVLTGDLTDLAEPVEYDAFREIMAPLEPPLFAIPGNHDARAPMREGLGAPDYLPPAGPLNWSRRIGALLAIGLDTTVPGKPHGHLEDTTLDWLDAVLSDDADTPAIVFTHHPPFDTGIRHMDRQRLLNGEVLLERLARHASVRLVASGHVHRMIATPGNGATPPCLIAPAPAHAVSLDHREGAEATFDFEPGAVLLHCWDAAGSRLQSQLSYIDAFDGPHPFNVAG